MNSNRLEQQRLCPYRHTEGSSYTPWTLGGPNEVTEVIVHRRGRQVKRRCLNCGALSGAIPMQAVWNWYGALGEPVVREGDMDPYPPCSYRGCTAPGMDEHHFAPKNTFADDADNWPVMPLCQHHHHEWHQLMDGYQWHRRRESASWVTSTVSATRPGTD